MSKSFNREHRESEKDLWELERKQSISQKFETILKLYSLFGLLIAIFGIAYFVFTTLNIELTISQQMALLISGSGIALSITSRDILLIRRERTNENIREIELMQGIGEFVWIWSKFEEISKQVLLSKGSKFNQYSIREVIEQLYKINLINEEEVIFLEKSIKIRNTVVHGKNIVSREVLDYFSSEINKIILKITRKGSND